jgi:hypothetical protein
LASKHVLVFTQFVFSDSLPAFFLGVVLDFTEKTVLPISV